MEQPYSVLKVFKYTLYFLIAAVLTLLWQGLFILQAAVGLEVNSPFLPVKFLPFFLYSMGAFWPILKMFDWKKKIPHKGSISFAVGAVAVILSVAFQHLIVSKRLDDFVFSNSRLSHMGTIVPNRGFKERLSLSFMEYLKFIPLGSFDRDSVSYVANGMAEAMFLLELKNVIKDKKIENICGQYLSSPSPGGGSCVVDIQKEVGSRFQKSMVGNLLLFSMGMLDLMDMKKIMSKKHGPGNPYVAIKTTNDMIEMLMLSVKRPKAILLDKGHSVQLTMGHEIRPSSVSSVMERYFGHRFNMSNLKMIESLLSGMDRDISSIKKAPKELSSETRAKLEQERSRSKGLRAQFLEIQEGGLSLGAVEEKKKKAGEELGPLLEEVKQRSLIFKVSAFFDPSLHDLSVEDLAPKKALGRPRE